MATDNVQAGAQVGSGPSFRAFVDAITGAFWGSSITAFITGGSSGAWNISAVTPATPLPVQVLSPQTGPTVADHSIASMSGSSQTLLPAGQSGKWTKIFNPVTNDPITVNLAGGAAAPGGVGCITIPGGSGESLPFVPANAVTCIGTTGQTLVCQTA